MKPEAVGSSGSESLIPTGTRHVPDHAHGPLYARVLGDAFHALAPKVQALHARSGLARYRGEVEVVRGTHWLARLCSRATRLPPAGKGRVEVEIEAVDGIERWTRYIGDRAMSSRLWEQGRLLCERLGPVRFGFHLGVEQGVVTWRVARVSALGVPLPAGWFRDVIAQESETEGRYRFDVVATLPGIGLLVHYRGWLHVE